MLAVGREDHVLRTDGPSGTDLGRLLAQARRPQPELTLALQRGRLGVEAADQDHVAVERTDLVVGDVERIVRVLDPQPLGREQLDHVRLGMHCVDVLGHAGHHPCESRCAVGSPRRTRSISCRVGRQALGVSIGTGVTYRRDYPGVPSFICAKAAGVTSLSAPQRRARPAGRIAQRVEPVAAVGPVPVRAAVGHGARGLFRRRRRLVLLPVRAVPRPGLPLGRGRARRDLRPLRLPELLDRDVERARPDPQGARVRPDQLRRATTARTSRSTGGSSTRPRPIPGCSGSTATRRPSSRISSCATRTPAAARTSASTNSADTGVLADEPLLRRPAHLRQGRAGRHLHRRSRRPTTARTRRRCTCCRTSGSATPGSGAAMTRKPALRRLDPPQLAAGRLHAVECEHAFLGRYILAARSLGRRATARPGVRQRDQRAGPVRRAPTRRRTSRTASTTGSCTATSRR